MYVIASMGHCVINGLNQVKVYEDRQDADRALEIMSAERGSRGFTVQYIQLIPKEEA
jgi:hypothetical protein